MPENEGVLIPPFSRRRIPSHRAAGRLAALAVLAALALAATGCEELFDVPPSSAPSGGGTLTRPDSGDAGTAARQLDELTVDSPRPMRGYSRDRFPHWRSVDSCDARESVLIRQGEDVVVGDGCRPRSGTWFSPFDEKVFTDPGDLDVDHLVPLANAWRSGADDWDDDARADFANDLDRPQLIAVSASSNRAKGDQDPAQWKPPNRDYWCQYAIDWIAVKHHWELTVTADEKAALGDMLETCT